jgi:20S proteasome alpha/beta subunit
MTVCIAAIYDSASILGASDRMITGGYGDIEFQPPAPKILNITNSIAVMTAGDQNIQMQVFQKAFQVVRQRIQDQPDKWVSVSDVAEIYSKSFYGLRNRLVEEGILLPYNLNFESFISKQCEMNQDFVDRIINRIDRFPRENIGAVETILAGIDDSGPHIYVVRNGIINCNDKLGFASIGIGSNHALSHFMFSSYSRIATESKALLTIHQAKKKAEVSPGVGEQTDMCHIGPQPGTFKMIAEPAFTKPIVKDLDNFYRKYKQQIDLLDKRTEEKIKYYLQNLNPPPQPKQELGSQPAGPQGPEPSDEKH